MIELMMIKQIHVRSKLVIFQIVFWKIPNGNTNNSKLCASTLHSWTCSLTMNYEKAVFKQPHCAWPHTLTAEAFTLL